MPIASLKFHLTSSQLSTATDSMIAFALVTRMITLPSFDYIPDAVFADARSLFPIQRTSESRQAYNSLDPYVRVGIEGYMNSEKTKSPTDVEHAACLTALVAATQDFVEQTLRRKGPEEKADFGFQLAMLGRIGFLCRRPRPSANSRGREKLMKQRDDARGKLGVTNSARSLYDIYEGGVLVDQVDHEVCGATTIQAVAPLIIGRSLMELPIFFGRVYDALSQVYIVQKGLGHPRGRRVLRNSMEFLGMREMEELSQMDPGVFENASFLTRVRNVSETLDDLYHGRPVDDAVWLSQMDFLKGEESVRTVFISSRTPRKAQPGERLVYGDKLRTVDLIEQMQGSLNKKSLLNFLLGMGETDPERFLKALLPGVVTEAVQVHEVADSVRSGEPVVISRMLVPKELQSKKTLSGEPGEMLSGQNPARCNSTGWISPATNSYRFVWHAMAVMEVVVTGEGTGAQLHLGVQNSWRNKAFLYATPDYLVKCSAEFFRVKSLHFVFSPDYPLAAGDSIVTTSFVGAPLDWFIFR
jgi:hypothetical protein